MDLSPLLASSLNDSPPGMPGDAAQANFKTPQICVFYFGLKNQIMDRSKPPTDSPPPFLRWHRFL